MKQLELQEEAYKLRYEFFNLFIDKEDKWHQKYKKHELYEIVIESFEYKFNEIGEVMPKLLQKLNS